MFVLIHPVSELLSTYLSSYTCEIFANEMRMGYARYYVQSDIRIFSRLNVGEAQSAMQNELKEFSDYMSELFFFIDEAVWHICHDSAVSALAKF